MYDNGVTVLRFENFVGGNYTHISKFFIKSVRAGQEIYERKSNETLKLR